MRERQLSMGEFAHLAAHAECFVKANFFGLGRTCTPNSQDQSTKCYLILGYDGLFIDHA
jgi:hypothetical protein